MGTYRLLLAIAVLLSHVGITFPGANQGVVAVISFFVLSGYVMTALIYKNYMTTGKIAAFYADRAFRLFPQYIFYSFVSLMFVLIARPISGFLTDLTAPKIILNFLMLPLGFYMCGLENAMIIPQAWSLGLEMSFYLAIPFILLYRLETYLFFVSCLFFALAFFGVINTDWFGYRLLLGTLFIFLCGSALYQKNKIVLRSLMFGAFFIAIPMFILTSRNPFFRSLHFNYEVLLGLLIGLPAVAMLVKRRWSKLDEFLGNLSYGVFLNHFLLIWIFQKLHADVSNPLTALLIVICAGAMATVTYFVIERPVIALRHKMRQNISRGAELTIRAT